MNRYRGFFLCSKTWGKFPRNYTDNFPRSMKGIGRGTIQRCDARPLTAPFLLMFHNYYHAINSNGTGGRPLRKRHFYALCVINTRVFLKTLSIVRNRPPPFSLSLCFFSFYKNRKRFPRSLANCPLFSPPPPPFRTHFSLFTRDYAGFSLSFAPPEVVLDNPPFFSSTDLNFSDRGFLFSILA